MKIQNHLLRLCAALVSVAACSSFADSSVTRHWIGGGAGDFRTASNWDPSGVPANTDNCFFTNDVAVNLNRPTEKADKNGSSYAYVNHTADGCTVTFSTLSDAGELVLWEPRSLAVANGGRWVFDNVELSKRVSSGSVAWDLAAGTYGFAPHSTNILHTTTGATAGVFHGELDNDAFIEVRDGGAYSFPGASTNYLGRLTAPTAMTNALGLAGNMAVWGFTSNTVTFVNALKYPTCSVMLPTIPHATPVSVSVNGFERLHDDDSYTVYSGQTLTATFAPEEGYALSTNVCVLSDITASCVIPDALLPVATKIVENEDAFVWTGGACDDDWETLANWSLNGSMPSTPPTIADRVLFPADDAWTLRLTNTVAVSNLNVRGNLEISGGLVQASLVCGEGLITLGDGAGFSTYDPAGSSLTVSNDLHIVGNVTFQNVLATSSQGSSIKLLGNLTGTGTATFSGRRLGCELAGDNRAFAGTVYVRDDGLPRNATYLASANASSSNACWHVENSGRRNFTPSGATCHFGELTGHFRRDVASNWTKISTDVIGARNTDFTTDGVFGTAGDRSDRIVKVGTGTMTFVGIRAKGFEARNGTILFTTTNSIPYDDYRFAGGTIRLAPSFDADISGRIRNSTGPIVFDDGGTNRTWATALAASNQRHEIVKRGAGTLTLAAAPAWDTVTVTVEEGELVFQLGGQGLTALPATPGADTLVTTNGDGTVSFKPNFATVEDGPHEIHNLNRGWSFAKAPLYPLTNYLQPTTNYQLTNQLTALSWTTVSLPHSINAHDTFNKQANDAGAPGWRGIAFYRRNIVLGQRSEVKGQTEEDCIHCLTSTLYPLSSKFLLEFETVRQAIYLWVNERPVGYYEAGIASSCFDITRFLREGTNEVTVAIDSTSGRGMTTYLSETVPGTEWNSQTGAGFQWNGNDFNPTEGGLTSSVRLHVKPQTYLTLPIYNNLKTSGTLVTASDFDFAHSNATIAVAAEVRNESGVRRRLALAVQVADAGTGAVVGAFTNEFANVPAASDAGTNFTTAVESDVYAQNGNGVWQGVSNVTTRLASGVETTVLAASATIGNLVFWSPDTPHLYDVRVQLIDAATAQPESAPYLVDEETIRTGFRKVAYGRDTGLTVNGKPFWLTGYAQRATDEWAAIGIPPDWLYEYDAALMRESGANFIRWMHIAPKPKMQRALDKYGVISVVPAGDKESAPGWGRAWSQRQEAMRDTILSFRNSPSAIFWEAGNTEIPATHMARMTEIRKALDPDGGRFMGCRSLQQADNVAAAEWVGTMLNRHADKACACMKETGNYIPILELEYAREESPRRCWDDYTPPHYDYVNKWLGSDGAKASGYDIYDCNQEDFTRTNFDEDAGYAHYYGHRVTGVRNRTYAGCAALCWSDSAQHGRNAWAENARMSGRVDPVRLKKPNFRAFQAAQATVPKIAILGHWSYEKKVGEESRSTEDRTYLYPLREWNGTYWEYTGEYGEREPTEKTVYVVGSVHCAKVELYVNDVLKGTRTEPERVFLFPFPGIDVTESGRVTARAYDADGNLIAEDSIVSVGAADHLDITVTTGPDGWQADGSDIAMVDIRLVDAAGTLLPAATNRLEFAIATSAAQPESAPYQVLQPSTFNLQPSFLGGYNSGTYDNVAGAPCGASPIGKDWVNLESGENRVFVRAGDEAGETTLTVSVPSLGWTTNVTLTSVAPSDFPQTFAANRTDYTAETDLPAVNDLGGNADPREYFWTDATGDHDPQKPENWSVATGADTFGDATDPPGFASTAYVAGEAVIRPSGANFNVSNLVVTGRCLLAPKAGEQTVCASILGDGTLVLSNATLRPYAENAPVYPTLEIAAGTTNAIAIGDPNFHAHTYGPLTGSGTLDLTSLFQNKNTYAGAHLGGDASAFTGTCRLYPFTNYKGTQLRDKHQFVATNSTSAAAHYEINVNAANDTMNAAVFPTAGTYRLGSLVGKNAGSGIANGVTLEIGGRDADSVFSGSWGGKNGAVVWTAPTATYSNRIAGVSAITATSAGTVVIGTNAMPTAALAFTGWNGTLRLDASDPALDPSAILSVAEGVRTTYDDEGVSRVWTATSLKGVAGILVKRGAGSLAVNAAPLGALVVEEGEALVGTRSLRPGEAVIGSTLALSGTLELNDALAPGSVYLYGLTTDTYPLSSTLYPLPSTNHIRGTVSVAGAGYTVGPSLAGGVGRIAFTGAAGTVILNNTEPYAIGAITNVAALYLNGNGATVNWDAIDKTSLGYVHIAGTNTLTSHLSPLNSQPSALFDRVQPVVADGARLYLQIGDDTYVYRGEDAGGEIEWEKREPDPTPVCQLGGQGLTALPATNWSVVVQGALTPLILSEVWSIGTNGASLVSLTSGGRDKVALADATASVEWSAYRHHTYAVTCGAAGVCALPELTLWIDGVKIATTTNASQLSPLNSQPLSFSLNADGKCTIDRCEIYDTVLARDFIERDAAAHPVTPTDEPVRTVHVVTGGQQATDLTGYDANTDLVIVTNAWGYFMKKAVSVECEVRFDGDVAFTMESGFSDTGTILASVTGSGDIVNGGKATTHTFYFQDAADFTGSIILTNQANRIAFAARMDESDWPVGGSDGSSGYFSDASRSQIYVAAGSHASLKDGGRWECNTRLTIDGTLACRGAARLRCAGGIAVGGEITIPEGYVRTDFYAKDSSSHPYQTDESETILPTEIVIEPALYVWTGAAGDTLWSSSNNWLRIGCTNLVEVPVPLSTVLIGPALDSQPSTLNPQLSPTNVIEISSPVSLASVTISNDANTAYLLRGSGALASSAALAKQGDGDLILESETLTMPIAIGAGRLLVDGSRLEQGLSLNRVTGGELEITAGTVTLTNDFETVVTIDAEATCVLTMGHKVAKNSSGSIRGAGTLEFANAIGYNGSARGWGSLGGMTGTVRMDAGTSIACATGNNCKQFGTGTLEIGGATVNASGGATSRYLGVGTINVLEGTSSTINEATARMYVTGNLLGGGSVAFTTTKRALVLSGDNAAFAGTLVHNGGTNYLDDPAIIEREATSAKAAWVLNATGSYADHGFTYAFKGDSAVSQPFAFGTLRLPNAATKLCFPENAWIEIGARGEACALSGTVVSNAVNLVVTGGAETDWPTADPLPAGSTVTVRSGVLKMHRRTTPYGCGTDTMTFTDGTTDYYLNVASEPPKADFTLDGIVYKDTYLMTAGSLLKLGSVLTLNGSTGLVRTFAPGVTDLTFDLGGQTLSNANDLATWMIAVGTNELTLCNGTIDCGNGYGIFVTDGRLDLSNVTIRAAGRCVQVAGAGTVRLDALSRLVTTGNDPTLMAVGGYDGRATVEIAGSVENICASVPADEEDWRYAVAGHAQDLAGVDFVFLRGAVLAAVAGRPPYLRPANGSGSFSDSRVAGVEIPDDWMTSHGYAAGTSPDTKGANGVSLAECYLLGLDPTDENDLPTATISFDADGNIVVTLEPEPPDVSSPGVSLFFVLEDVDLGSGGAVKSATTNNSSAFTIERDPARTQQFFRIKTLLRY